MISCIARARGSRDQKGIPILVIVKILDLFIGTDNQNQSGETHSRIFVEQGVEKTDDVVVQNQKVQPNHGTNLTPRLVRSANTEHPYLLN